jgi:hypothetical protein
MDERYLILHKVKGQAAVDVAQRIAFCDGEEIWFIPTSGNRAYPLRWQALDPEIRRSADTIEEACWDALPDHYPRKQRKETLARLRTRLREIWRTSRVREKVLRSA